MTGDGNNAIRAAGDGVSRVLHGKRRQNAENDAVSTKEAESCNGAIGMAGKESKTVGAEKGSRMRRVKHSDRMNGEMRKWCDGNGGKRKENRLNRCDAMRQNGIEVYPFPRSSQNTCIIFTKVLQ